MKMSLKRINGLNTKVSLFCKLARVLVLCAIAASCSSKQAPQPRSNPDARDFKAIRIKLFNASVINNVKVISVWQIGNHNCAPIVYPEGYLNLRFVNADEEIVKSGDVFNAKILKDRYLQDECRWFLAGIQVRFLHDQNILALYALNPKSFLNKGEDEIVCFPTDDRWDGYCYMAGNVPAKLIANPRKFQVKLEVMP